MSDKFYEVLANVGKLDRRHIQLLLLILTLILFVLGGGAPLDSLGCNGC